VDGAEGRARGTDGRHGLGHLGHDHDDGESPTTKGSDGQFVVDVAQLGLGVEDADVI